MKVRFVSKATYINITAKGLMLQPDISHDVHYVNPFFRPGGDTRRNAKRAVERAAKMQQEVEKIKRYFSQKGNLSSARRCRGLIPDVAVRDSGWLTQAADLT